MNNNRKASNLEAFLLFKVLEKYCVGNSIVSTEL